MFELKNVKAARLWMLPPAAMEVAIKLLWEDKVASRVCCTSFHDPHVVEGLGKKRRHIFHRASGRPVFGEPHSLNL